MTPIRHPDWYTVVRRHWRRTTGYLLASHEPCLTIRDEEIASVKGRMLVGRSPEALARWRPPVSWIIGMVLCPGDSVEPLVEWFRPLGADPSRVWFYLYPDTDYRMLTPWEAAGYGTDQVDYVATWQELHKLFGLALNDRVYADRKDLGPAKARPK